ncbi:MAG: ribosome small subunit-dependent GTPase A [Bacteroidota bacterium]
MKEGIVTKSTGKWYDIQLEDGKTIKSQIKGKFRLDGMDLTNPVAVGDKVLVNLGKDETGMITKIMDRENYVIRQSPRKKHQLHLMASNIDHAIVIMTIVNPMLKQGFIDRYLLMVEPYNIPTTIVFNKADLYDDEALDTFAMLYEIYTKIGYNVLLVSAIERKGLNQLKDLLKNKITLVSGQSGVGKSTLINALQPQLELRTQEISDYSGKGQHTTTFAEMFTLSFGGQIIDTPGIKSLSFNHLEPADIAHNFREFFELSDKCKFGGSCLHRNEPNCAVKEALQTGEISELRYFNYLTLLEEAEEQNYWERKKNF